MAIAFNRLHTLSVVRGDLHTTRQAIYAQVSEGIRSISVLLGHPSMLCNGQLINLTACFIASMWGELSPTSLHFDGVCDEGDCEGSV